MARVRVGACEYGSDIVMGRVRKTVIGLRVKGELGLTRVGACGIDCTQLTRGLELRIHPSRSSGGGGGDGGGGGVVV